MIGFAMVGSNDMPRARGFYDPLMPLLAASVNVAWSTDTRVWYMTAPDAPMLVVTRPYDGQPANAGFGSMVAFAVSSREAVLAVHSKALELGGADELQAREVERAAVAGGVCGTFPKKSPKNPICSSVSGDVCASSASDATAPGPTPK